MESERKEKEAITNQYAHSLFGAKAKMKREAKALIELFHVIDIDEMEEWIFDFFDDMDVVTCLYSGLCLDENHIYHFSHWADERF